VGCHLGGSAVGVSAVIADGLCLGDVFGGLEVHGVGIFIVVFFSFFVLRFGFKLGVRFVLLVRSLGWGGGAGSLGCHGNESLGGVLVRVGSWGTARVAHGV